MFVPVGKRMLVELLHREDVPGLTPWPQSPVVDMSGKSITPVDPFEYGKIAVLSAETEIDWEVGQVVIFSASAHRPEIEGQVLLPQGDILMAVR